MAAKKGGNTVRIAETLIAPIIEKHKLILWDTRFEKEGGQWYLRYFIDKEGGVNISDCENVSRAVDKLLDEADPIEHSYILEVSSPGIERELVKDHHFQRYIGSLVTVKLIRPAQGRREFTGRLISKQGDTVTISLDGDIEMSFLKKEASGIRLAADYETGGLSQ